MQRARAKNTRSICSSRVGLCRLYFLSDVQHHVSPCRRPVCCPSSLCCVRDAGGCESEDSRVRTRNSGKHPSYSLLSSFYPFSPSLVFIGKTHGTTLCLWSNTLPASVTTRCAKSLLFVDACAIIVYTFRRYILTMVLCSQG